MFIYYYKSGVYFQESLVAFIFFDLKREKYPVGVVCVGGEGLLKFSRLI